MREKRYYFQVKNSMTPYYAFESDGCSGGMSFLWNQTIRRLTGKYLPWEGCCVAHDWAYWKGGTIKDRLAADLALYAGVKLGGHPYIAQLMYWGVRVGGSPYWPLSWRWGYGWHPSWVRWLRHKWRG